MSVENPSGTSATCPQHPSVAANFVCARCRTPVCGECCFTGPGGDVCCKTCYFAEPVSQPAPATGTVPPAATPPPLPTRNIGVGCVQHPRVMAVTRCENCDQPSCRTCDFTFPGGLHFCPVCIGEATSKLSPQRKRYMIAACVLAGWASLGFLALLTGAVAGLAEDKFSELLIGFGMILVVGIPAIIGAALGMTARRPGGPNPVVVWVALIWNALILSGFILLIIVGNFSQ